MNTGLPLRDIHLPDPVSWWPPAPGWWVLVLLCLILTGWLYHRYRRSQARRILRHSMEHEWRTLQDRFDQHRDPQLLVQDLSVFLRRVAMSVTERNAVAGQTGSEWLLQLDELAGTRLFDSATGRQLLTAPYQPATEIDAGELLAISRQWLTLIEKKQVLHADL